MNPDHRYTEPITLLIGSGVSFLTALVAYIVTALKGYYDDGFGVSYLYGRKDFLILTISSAFLVGLAAYLIIQAARKRKTEDWVRPVLLASSTAVYGFFILAEAIKPLIKGEFIGENLEENICLLVASFFGLLAIVLGLVLIVNLATKKMAYHSLYATVFLMACFAASIGVYCISRGISSLKLNDLFYAISLFVIAGAFALQSISLIIGAKNIEKF